MFTRKVMLGAAVAAGLVGSPAIGNAACTTYNVSPNSVRDYTCNAAIGVGVALQTAQLIRITASVVPPAVLRQEITTYRAAVSTVVSNVLSALALLNSRIRFA